jgi:16S rRNA C967 or C1407 C5-methylase (RsmB/RsmF family)
VAREILDESEIISVSQDSLLAKYVRHFHSNQNTWLSSSIERLPETLRVHESRIDSSWTKALIESFGGERVEWLPNIQAYALPFSRGKSDDEFVRQSLRSLHETGRITRQEVASMVPTECIDYSEDMIVLDMCASPGSKTTQLAEHLFPSGAVIANEPSSGRLNTLSSNRSRAGLYNIIVTKHDGRHFPNIPQPGFDAIVVDAPCTGSATTRKNPEVWSKWSPTDGKSMFKLQLDLLNRASSLLKEQGQLVYSTCSIDPIENEAVVAEFLRSNPNFSIVENISKYFGQHVFESGKRTWPLLDNTCSSILSAEQWLETRHSRVEMLPPEEDYISFAGRRTSPNLETNIQQSLEHCLRLWPETKNTGGFFVAKFVKNSTEIPVQLPPTRTIEPRDADDFIHLSTLPSELTFNHEKVVESLWSRGKKIMISPKVIQTRLHAPTTRNSKNAEYPEHRFAPLRVIHLGSPIFVEKKGVWRLRHEGVVQFPEKHLASSVKIPIELAMKLLLEGQIEFDDLPNEFTPLKKGPILLMAETERFPVHISAWIGQKLTPMVSKPEQNIILQQLESKSKEVEQ